MSAIVYFTIFSVVGLAMSLTWAVYRSLQTTREKAEFDRALEIIQSSEITELDTFTETELLEQKKSFSWSRFWANAALQAGRIPDDPSSPGRFALGAFVIGSAFGVLVYPGGIFGLFLGAILLALGWFWLDFEAGRRKVIMEKQMPILLSSLRSQMHAGVTVQSALMNIAEELPAPLGDEVRLVKRDINVSIPLEQALEALADRVRSRQMQFLVASIGIAVKSGSDLVPQLVTIEEIAQQRARIEGKIKAAVALAKPTAILAAGAPVAAFLWFSITDPTYAPYFFGPGILLFALAVGLYVFGLFVLRFLVKGVEKT